MSILEKNGGDGMSTDCSWRNQGRQQTFFGPRVNHIAKADAIEANPPGELVGGIRGQDSPLRLDLFRWCAKGQVLPDSRAPSARNIAFGTVIVGVDHPTFENRETVVAFGEKRTVVTHIHFTHVVTVRQPIYLSSELRISRVHSRTDVDLFLRRKLHYCQRVWGELVNQRNRNTKALPCHHFCHFFTRTHTKCSEQITGNPSLDCNIETKLELLMN